MARINKSKEMAIDFAKAAYDGEITAGYHASKSYFDGTSFQSGCYIQIVQEHSPTRRIYAQSWDYLVNELLDNHKPEAGWLDE